MLPFSAYELSQGISAVAAFFAAALWARSALIRVRPLMELQLQGDGSLEDTLRRQSKWSALGAAAAGVSALAQGVSLILN